MLRPDSNAKQKSEGIVAATITSELAEASIIFADTIIEKLSSDSSNMATLSWSDEVKGGTTSKKKKKKNCREIEVNGQTLNLLIHHASWLHEYYWQTINAWLQY